MHFDFDQDRVLFRDSVRALLAKECTPERLRELAETESARARELWAKLAGIGLIGLRIPEEHGGLGLTELDLVLPLEETGRSSPAEPVVDSAAVGGAAARRGRQRRCRQWSGRPSSGPVRRSPP